MSVASVIAVLIVLAGILVQFTSRTSTSSISAELAKAMTYPEVGEGENAVDGTDNVKFDAFFLRDINGDGYAESIRGTSKQIGEEDTLYMELNVQTAGYLKDGKIEINGENFYLQTTLPKDNELKDSYIGNNTKTIEFENLQNGTQKMLTGMVRSGDYTVTSKKAAAIGNNINNYSRVNSVILTGTYVGEDGTETPISKTVEFNIDWYGETTARIYTTSQSGNIENAIDEDDRELSLNFTVYTEETDQELILAKNHVEGEIPLLNGYAPLRVEYTGSTGVFNYDAENRTFTIEKEAKVNEEGKVTTSIARSNSYGMRVVYPLEAYEELGEDTVQIRIPVRTNYEGYNNPSEEFENPYVSNTASSTIVATYEKPEGTISYFEVTVGKRVYSPSSRYIVSKEKPIRMYNGIVEEETEDTYTVLWRAYIGTNPGQVGITMKETEDGEAQVSDNFIKTDSSDESTEDIVSNVGIYFSGADSLLGNDGWIRVYDDETDELIHEFTAKDWASYSSSNPYRYELPIKHIRIETSEVVDDERNLYVYNIKEIDDEKITEKYTREEFDNLQYIESTLEGYLGEEHVDTDVHEANYEAPISVANISILNDTISSQTTDKNNIIRIETEANTSYNEVRWQNGTFLVKLPEEIIDVQLNEVSATNPSIEIESYEVIENEEGLFIKVVTKNETPATYAIEIDVDLTADPRKPTVSRNIELYATNENGENYYYSTADKYDVNNNLNTEEKVNYRTDRIEIVAPNSLITAQTASEYDDNGSEIVSPEIADLKPVYAIVDQEQEEQTAKIGVQIRNNYGNTISEIDILGKIPFEGNTYVISGGDLGSTFTTKMVETGIEVPEELQEYVTVYYSENENPTKEIENEENGWVRAEEVENWENIKTYLIDLGDYVMETGDEEVFYYTVKIPNGLEFNQVAFSHHGVYFCLDTDQGKYETQTEPNRLGLRIAEKFNLEITKYQTNKDIQVSGATYRITDIYTGESKTGVTNSEGKLEIANLYAEKEYEIREIKSPDEYELNSEAIRFIGHVDEEGTLTIEKLQGTTKGDMTVEKKENENYKVKVQVEDEVKARLKIIKKEEGTDNLIQGVKFTIEEVSKSDVPEQNSLDEGNVTSATESSTLRKTVTTNSNGEITITGLSVGKIYRLQEIKAEGYYVDKDIYFTIVNDNGTYKIDRLDSIDEIENQETTEENGIPTITITIENEKIPTYDLQIVKIKKTTETTLNEDERIANAEADIASSEVEYLEGAKFRLYKGTELIGEYTTDEQGRITIQGLYQDEGEGEWNEIYDQTYTLKEVEAPVGYAKVQDITFKAVRIRNDELEDYEIKLVEINETGEEIESERYTVEGNTVQLVVEDSPSFKLIKKDGETGEVLAGVKFAIYDAEDGIPARNSKGEIIGEKETINGAEYYVVETNSNGEITADLPEGLYKAIEVEADEKYDIAGQVYYFGIGASKEIKKEATSIYATSFGDDKNDYINSVVATSDGGYIVGGAYSSRTITVEGNKFENRDYSGSGTYSDILLIKYDENGNIIWINTIGSVRSDSNPKIIETRNNGILVEFTSNGYGIDIDSNISNNIRSDIDRTEDVEKIYLIKFNLNGEMEWYTRTTPNIEDFSIEAITEDIDGNIILGGYYTGEEDIIIEDYSLENQGNGDAFIIQYSNDGKFKSAESVGGSGTDRISSVAGSSDGGYIVGGYFNSDSLTVGDYTLTNDGESDVYIIKYNNKNEIEWADSFGGSSADYIDSIATTSDGGYIVGGHFISDSLTVGNYTLTNNGGSDVFIVKYNNKNEIEWADSFGGSSADYIGSIATTSDGGYIIGGRFQSSITIGNYTLTSNGMYDGFIAKYNANKEIEWAEAFGGNRDDYIYSIAEVNNGEFLTGGQFQSDNITVGNYTLENKTPYGYLYRDGFLIKFKEKEVIGTNTSFAMSIGESNIDAINSVAATSDGGYIVGGCFWSDSITIGKFTLEQKGSRTGMIIKYNANNEVEWANAIGYEVYSVAATSDRGYIVGGSTLDRECFIIKYGENDEIEWTESFGKRNSIDSISVVETLDKGYVVVGRFSRTMTVGDNTLTNNGYTDIFIIKYNANREVEWVDSFGGNYYDYINSVIATRDGGYAVVGYFQSDSITVGDYTLTNNGGNDSFIVKYNNKNEVESINSFDSNYYGYIRSITATEDGGYIVGGNFKGTIILGNYTLESNGSTDGIIIKYNANNEVEYASSFGGNVSDYIYSVVATEDGGYIVGGKFGGTIILGNYTLESNGGTDVIIIKYNANGEVEFAYSFEGNNSDYISSVVATEDGGYVIGGNFYDDNLIIGDYTLTNNGSSDGFIAKIYPDANIPEVEELTVENERKEFEITTDVNEIDGVKGGSISGEDESPYETVKYGDSNTKEIVMTPEEGYEIIGITINGEEYPYEVNSDGLFTMPEFDNVTENKHVEVTYALTSNKFTINKVDSNTKEHLAGVRFRVENINEENEVTNTVTITTNSEGQAISQLEYGRYQITELETLEGYELLENPIIVEFTREGNSVVENNNEVNVTVNEAGEFIIENKETAKVIVHHYLKDEDGTYTEIKVAEDDVLEGKAGDKYTTTPHLDLERYELEKDEAGKYVVPTNATGKYEDEYIHVTYYYELKEIPLIVHHYIEGTEERVPLATGELAEDEEYIGKEGESYTTEAISEEELDERYELVEVPTNAKGEYAPSEVEVTYYYRLKQASLLIEKVGDNGEKVSGVTLKIVNKETLREWTYETDENGRIEIELPNGEYEITEISGPGEYKLLREPINVIVEPDQYNQITIENERYKEFDLNLTKEDEKTKERISGVEFKLTFTTQYGVKVEENYVTDKNGMLIIENLYDDIEYTLEEITTPKGYVQENKKYKFKVNYVDEMYQVEQIEGTFDNLEIQDNQINVTVENTPIEVEKIGEEGQALEGVTFKILNKETNEEFESTTNENGKLEISLPRGEYEITEIRTLDGYKLLQEPINITIEPDQDNQITIENERYKEFDLNLTKEDEETKERISGVEFKLTFTTQYGVEVEEKYVTDENGMLTIENLYDGIEYTLEEATPKGYVNNNDVYKFKVNYVDGMYQVEQIEGTFDNLEIQDNQINVTVENTPTLKLVKEDQEGEVVEGAKFTITDEEGNTVLDGNGNIVGTEEEINGEIMTVVTTDAEGKIVENLEPGRYVITEVEAPYGHVLPENEEDRTQTIEITSSGFNGTIIEKTGEVSLENFMPNVDDSNLESLSDGPVILNNGNVAIACGLLADMTIPAESTVDGEEITLTKESDEDGIVFIFTPEGQVVDVYQVKSNQNGANILAYIWQTKDNGIVGLGEYEGGIEITGEETTSGESISINSEMNAYIIKYNSEGKVEWANNFSTVIALGGLQPYDMYTVGNKLVMLLETEEESIVIPGEETSSGEDIVISNEHTDTVPGMMISLTINEEGKIEKATDLYSLPAVINLNNLLPEGFEMLYPLFTENNEVILTGAIQESVTIDGTQTANGESIEITVEEGMMAGVVLKYNAEGKIEWAKEINASMDPIGVGYTVYMKEVETGYVGMGMVMGTITIPGEKTANGEPIIIQDTTMNGSIFIIKYNTEGQVEWAEIMTEGLDSFSGSSMPEIRETPEGYVFIDSDNMIMYQYEEIATDLVAEAQEEVTFINEAMYSKVTTHHYIEGTEEKVPSNVEGEVVEDVEQTGKVGDRYETTSAENVDPAYEVVSVEGEETGEYTEEEKEVTYYYRLKDPVIESSIVKTTDIEVITNKDEEIPYEINYTASIRDYRGKAEVTIVDYLPYELKTDEAGNLVEGIDIAGGIYDAETKTITWVETIEGIDTYAMIEDSSIEEGSTTDTVEENTEPTGEVIDSPTAYEINIVKEIKVIYEEVDTREEAVENTAEGTIRLENPEKEMTVEENEIIPTEYQVSVPVEKVWDDNGHSSHRPADVTIQVTANGETTNEQGEELPRAELNGNNHWSYTFNGLDKYTSDGEEIEYSVIEEETIEGDLEYYEEAVIEKLEDGSGIIRVTNSYKDMNTEVEQTIEKTGTDLITSSKDRVSYSINYNALIESYIGEGTVTIIDYLPYHIDEEQSELDGGDYDPETNSIAWTEELGHINTYEAGEKEVNITKDIEVVFSDLDATKAEMTNRVEGIIELPETNTREEVEDSWVTRIEIPGKVITKYVDIDTNEEIATSEELNGLVGDEYETEQKEITGYDYVRTEGQAYGEYVEGTIEVIYYYRIKDPVIESNITKTTDKEEITSKEELIPYEINYSSSITNYRGDGVLTIIDYLPYKIDITKSNLNDGVYDEATQTITWTEEITDIDTYVNGPKQVERTKTIEVVYVDMDVTKDLVSNDVTGTMTLSTPEKEVTVEEWEEIPVDFEENISIQKIWEDNDDIKGNRPESIRAYLTANGEIEQEVILDENNGWSYVFVDLPKYTEDGEEIEYSAIEEEVKEGDLEYYDEAVVERTGNTIRVTNSYKLMETDLEAAIDKIGTEKITSSSDEVSYSIVYNAVIRDYIGEGYVTIVDYLPYEIDVEKSELNGGEYDDETRTITWKETTEHINTYENGPYTVEVSKEVTVVYKEIDDSQDVMTNRVTGTIDLYETEQTNTVEDTYDTLIEIPGKVIVRYVDKATGEDIESREEITGLAGDNYTTEQKEIYGYTYIENSGNVSGIMTEEEIYVTYYYDRTEAGKVTAIYIDEETGEEIATSEELGGYIGDGYSTEQKEIENYEFVRVEGETTGTFDENEKQVIYVYKKIPARVIVRYLEKDETPEDDSDNVVLAEGEIINGYSGDEYYTERKEIENYRAANPEPENKVGEMTKEDIYVTYYYERIPSGTVTAIYVDVDTGEEITYVEEESGENRTYREEMQGYCGDEYVTSSKDIPYYTYLEEMAPENSSGIYSEEDVIVTYYYQKKPFNIGVDKNLTKIELNGTEQRVEDGKLNKVEIPVGRVSDSTLEVTYSIVITNTGEIEGRADVIESLPEYFEVIEGTSNEWEETATGLKATVELQAGEQKELEVVLRWERGANHFGALENTVGIVNVENPAGYEETTTEDNASRAELVVSVKSGEDRSMLLIAMTIGVLVIVAGTIAYGIKKTERKE